MKILLVEDDERLSRSLARLLVQDRHNVEVAADGETGLEIALGENGIDVVVLDIGLPDSSGIEVARRIRRDKRDLAILMLAARDPMAHRSLIWFTIWSSIVHGGIMGIQSVANPHHIGHLFGDVAALIAVAAVLAVLTPRSVLATK